MAKEKRASVFFNRETFEFVGLKEDYINQLKSTYIGIDVDKELKKMGLWLASPKGDKRKGDTGFILNWLNNASPSKALLCSQQSESDQHDCPLRPFINDYLKDLWKGREHILEFNKTRKKS